jgi:endonuclease YncB( thermonuclease family)
MSTPLPVPPSAGRSYDVREILRVVDGDTVDLTVGRKIDFGFYVNQDMTASLRFRLFGINAPELHGKSAPAGLLAKEKLIELLDTYAPIHAVTYKADDFGRWLVTLFGERPDSSVIVINEEMVRLGFAIPYKP